MLEPAFTQQLDLTTLGRLLHVLGSAGFLSGPADTICSLLIAAGVVVEGKDQGRQHPSQALVATNHLFVLGPSRSTTSAIRRVMSLCSEYREHLLDDLCTGLQQLPDDKALADTLEHLDHLSCELLARLGAAPPPQPSPNSVRHKFCCVGSRHVVGRVSLPPAGGGEQDGCTRSLDAASPLGRACPHSGTCSWPRLMPAPGTTPGSH